MSLAGLFFLTLGLIGLAAGIASLLAPMLPGAGLSCKAICGLQLLVTELVGARAGAVLAGLLWLAAGGAFAYVGLRLLRERSRP